MPTQVSSNPILRLEKLSKHFGGVQAVVECDLEVEEGTVAGLIGPNGAGKSTLLELVGGFLRADAGRISFCGKDITKLPAHARSRRGLIRSFQAAREWGGLTTLENVLVAATPISEESLLLNLFRRVRLRRAEKIARERAREVLVEFGLDNVRDELARNLSGGRSGLEFARIVATQPKMVLDEPQAGVNPMLIDRMAVAIEALNSKGVTILIIEHNLAFVERLCSVVNVMDLGTNIAKGTMGNLRTNAAVVDAYLGAVGDVG